MRLCWKCWIIAFIFASQLTWPLRADPLSYIITDLGTLGGQYSDGIGINSSGLVVGQSTVANNDYRAFYFNGGMIQQIAPTNSVAWGINDLGDAVGQSGGQAFIYNPANGLQSLADPPGFKGSFAFSINNANQAVGWSLEGNQTGKALLWQNGNVTQLAALPGTISSGARAINQLGDAIGTSNFSTGGGDDRATMWKADGSAVSLGSLGTASFAEGINDNGGVVGYSSDGNFQLPFYWTAAGGMKQLPLPSGIVDADAHGINNAGDIVGWVSTAEGGNAVIWQSGKVYDLTNLLRAKSGWTRLESAYAINNAGQITGFGAIHGENHAFLLTPIRWNLNGGGKWLDAANWFGGLPDAPSALANFWDSLSTGNAPATITLDGDRTVGKIGFNSATQYIIAPGTGGTLFIDNGGNAGEINVISGSHSITAPLSIVDSTNVDIASDGSLSLGGVVSVAANRGLSKSGAGAMTITGALNMGFNSTLVVSGGALSINSDLPASIGANIAVTINGGATLNVGGAADPFTDGNNANQHVIFFNNGVLNIISGDKAAARVSGSGAIIVGDGSSAATLSAKFFRGNSLTIRAGAQVNSNGDGTSSSVSKFASLNIDGVSGNWKGKFDLANNDLVLLSDDAAAQATLDTIADQIRSARGSGSSLWQGNGISSSAAAASAKGITGLAAIRNMNATGGTIYRMFEEQAVDTDSILVKYTYNGDTDLNGKIDASDYFQIDSGFIAGLSGYRNGDFDYNGLIDADDYFLIDGAFVQQSGVLGGSPIGVTAIPEASAACLITALLSTLAVRRRTH